jgi:hypothetical protein
VSHQAGFYRSFVRVLGSWGHAGLAREPGEGVWSRGLPCSLIAADPGRVEGMRSLPTRASNTGLASLPNRPGRSPTPVSIMTRQFPCTPEGSRTIS